MNKKAVKQLTKQGCIVAKEAAENLTDEDVSRIEDLDSAPMYISKDMLSKLRTDKKSSETSEPEEDDKSSDTNEDEGETEEMEETVHQEEEKEDAEEEEEAMEERDLLDGSQEEDNVQKADINLKDTGRRKDLDTKVEILDEADISKEEKDVPEFLQYYNDRYDRLKNMLMRRMEMQSAVAIKRLRGRDEGDETATVGLVKDKYSTNSGKWIVELEDKTGTFKALIDEREGEKIVQDEIIGVLGSMGGDIIYVNSVVRPDLPIPQGVKTTSQKVEAAYISDLHIGSKDTRHDKLEVFADWLKSDDAKDIGYLVLAGDMVEGVGTYPGQRDDLKITDIYKQYRRFEEWVEKIPEQIQIIVGPGNHDITRLAEPQPVLPDKAIPNIKDFNNVHRVQNPQTVRLHGIRSEGIKNLMYHGHSFDDHVDQIQDLREKAYQEPEHVMIDLLKRRHLAPTYGSNQMSPEGKDHLVIEEQPDIFVAGHFHSHANQSYKGVNVINSSSFQEQTDFQKRVGHKPDPGKVTVVDYKTRNTRVKKFF